MEIIIHKGSLKKWLVDRWDAEDWICQILNNLFKFYNTFYLDYELIKKICPTTYLHVVSCLLTINVKTCCYNKMLYRLLGNNWLA